MRAYELMISAAHQLVNTVDVRWCYEDVSAFR